MKKFISSVLAIILVVSLAFGFNACSKNKQQTADIVYITDGATITDGGYNQMAWDGVKSYADENNMSCRYYQPALDENEELTYDTITNYIKLAVDNGAKYIVMAGDEFSVAVYDNAPIYNDVNFLLVDAFTHPEESTTTSIVSNVMYVNFDELQAGFLAGACSVLDGYTKLGYFGSVNSATSGDYGAGYVQGASYVADKQGTPVIMQYADYDSANLDYDYSFTVKAVYQDIPKNDGETYYTVKVVNGLGSGTYKDGDNVTITANDPEAGKVFDHWECKSNTSGVKDKKVNISSSKKSSMNLLVEKCDCTITAVYADAKTYPVNVIGTDGTSNYKTYNVTADSTVTVTAPAALTGTVFDHWQTTDDSVLSDANSATTDVNISDSEITLTPVYKAADSPTFNITVEGGTGSGSYLTDDYIELVADAPAEGKMFVKWENYDSEGNSTGIQIENEYNYNTSFTVVDRYASIVEKMFDEGTQVVFVGGNDMSGSAYTAGKNFDYDTYIYDCGVDNSSWDDCIASVVTDYSSAVKQALESYKAGTIFTADCSNNCIYVSGKSINPTYKDDDGNDVKDEAYNKTYASIYKALANNKIKLVNLQSGGDVRKAYNSKCLTLNYWVNDDTTTTVKTADKK